MKILSICLAILLTGCAIAPDSTIKQPLTAQSAPPAVAADNSGAIFQAGRSNPRMGIAVFEDRRARQVGDTLSVNLVENSVAKRTSSSTDEKKVSGSIGIGAPTLLGYHNIIGASSFSPSADNKQESTDNRSNANSVSGTITVTVTEVLPNGNLRVAGEKQVTINTETEFIRLAGVVNPQLITQNNTINSTQLADVRFESKSAQHLDTAQLGTMLTRFFLTVIPF
jgi:flagellar L-ring protein precursor FlgH